MNTRPLTLEGTPATPAASTATPATRGIPDTLQYVAPWEMPFFSVTPGSTANISETEKFRIQLILALTSPLYCGQIIHPKIPEIPEISEIPRSSAQPVRRVHTRWDLFLYKGINAPGLQVPILLRRLPQDPELSGAELHMNAGGTQGVYFVSPTGSLRYHFPRSPRSPSATHEGERMSQLTAIADFSESTSTGATSFLRRAKQRAIQLNYAIHINSHAGQQLMYEMRETRLSSEPEVRNRIYGAVWLFECGCSLPHNAITPYPIERRCPKHNVPYVTASFRSYGSLRELLPNNTIDLKSPLA